MNIENFDIEVFDVLESTNTLLKEMAKAGQKEGKVLIAKEQTGGRGKLSRTFFSPKNSGIYMSVLLMPDMEAEKASLVTAMTSVAVAEAIEEVSGKNAEIKWVNDIYIEGKKVCGILTEAGLKPSSIDVAYCVVGIGINLKTAEGGFPDEISKIAGAVFENDEYSEDKREELISLILCKMKKYYSEFSNGTYREKYKKRSCLLGREILVSDGIETKKATAMDIDDDCRLIVKFDDGNQKALFSGDVTIKM